MLVIIEIMDFLMFLNNRKKAFTMSQKNTLFIQNCFFILICSFGGLLLSLTGYSLGWMVGTLITATLLSYKRPNLLKPYIHQKGLQKYWLNFGMFVLGIELGLKINLAVTETFRNNWSVILFTLFLSILFSLLTGYILWKFSSLSMMTSFISTTPGGLSVMSAIADEVGANTAVVSIVQSMRVFLVVCFIPFILSFGVSHNEDQLSSQPIIAPVFEVNTLLWTVVIVIVGIGGFYIGKKLRLPAPWLVGSMIAVAIVQIEAAAATQHDMIAWWPHSIIILAQICIGASIGSRIHKSMFVGLKNIILLSLAGTLGLIIVMILCSYFVSLLTDISFITTTLAFAPGGITEMTTAALLFHADPTFVVAVQILRVIFVCVLLPPLYKFLNARTMKRQRHVG